MKNLYKLYILFSLAIMSSSASAQHDTDLYTFEETVNLKSVNLVVLGKVIYLQLDTTYDTIGRTVFKLEKCTYDTEYFTTSLPKYMIVEIEKVFKGIEKRKRIKVLFEDCNWNRLHYFSFKYKQRYYLCLSKSGYFPNDSFSCSEPKGDYGISYSGKRYAQIKDSIVYEASVRAITVNSKAIKENIFNIILDSLIKNKFENIFDKNTASFNCIWVRSTLDPFFGQTDSSGFVIDGIQHAYNETYNKIPLTSKVFHKVGKSYIRLNPAVKKYYSLGQYGALDPDFYYSSHQKPSEIGCFRFVIKNPPCDSFSYRNFVRNIKRTIISNDSSYYLAELGTMGQHYSTNISLRNTAEDTLFCELDFYFLYNEKITIEYDFSNKTYHILFDGYLTEEEMKELYGRKRGEHWNDYWRMKDAAKWRYKYNHPYKYPSKLIEE